MKTGAIDINEVIEQEKQRDARIEEVQAQIKPWSIDWDKVGMYTLIGFIVAVALFVSFMSYSNIDHSWSDWSPTECTQTAIVSDRDTGQTNQVCVKEAKYRIKEKYYITREYIG